MSHLHDDHPELSAPLGASETLSAHDHGNCELCDQIERDLAAALEESAKLRAEVERLRGTLLPAWVALDKIDANPNDMETRRHAEVAAFYAVQRARAAK